MMINMLHIDENINLLLDAQKDEQYNIYSLEAENWKVVNTFIEKCFRVIANKSETDEYILIGFEDGRISKEIIKELMKCSGLNEISTYVLEKNSPFQEFLFAVKKKKIKFAIYLSKSIYGMGCFKMQICFEKHIQFPYEKELFETKWENKESASGVMRGVLFISREIDEMYIFELNKQVLEEDSLAAMKSLLEWKCCKSNREDIEL